MKPAGKYVLDSYALLAFLENEAGARDVARILEWGSGKPGRVFLSVINLGECLYIIERERGMKDAHRALALIDQLPGLEIIHADRTLTLAAAHIKASYAVSYADAFAVALAHTGNATVVTGDPEFKRTEHIVKVCWV